MNYSITQHGEPLDKSKYTIDEETKTFSTTEDNLVLDFSGIYGWTFKTGSRCTFKTNSYCTFDTGSYCTFDTGSDCTFDTGGACVVVRRDIYEVIELDGSKKIKLTGWGESGYDVVEEEPEEMIEIGGKKYSVTTLKEALKQYVE